MCVPARYALWSGSNTDERYYSLTTISLSRLLLNLRDVAYRSDIVPATEGSPSGTHVSSIKFSRFVGPLGNAVGHEIQGGDEENSDEEVYLTEDAITAGSTAPADIELEPIGRAEF